MEVKRCTIVFLSISLLANFLTLVYGGPVDLNANHSNVSKGKNTSSTMNIHSDLIFQQKQPISAGNQHNLDGIVFPGYIEAPPPEVEMIKEQNLNSPPKNITIGNRNALLSLPISYPHPIIATTEKLCIYPEDQIRCGP